VAPLSLPYESHPVNPSSSLLPSDVRTALPLAHALLAFL